MKKLLLALMLLATPAAAQDWRAYENNALGYAVDVPAGLGQVAETDEGLVVQSPTVTLTVFGLRIDPMDFASAVETAIASSADEGFVISERVVTPEWARYAAVNGAQLQAVGLVALCEEGTIAAYELRYMEADTPTMTSIIERLASTLRVSRPC